ncbi:class I SAM-dependent methyltransferase [Streptomyces sp. TP-A0356]|uniref:class I SAM-dependent methyltransferase n=1 Tax=Streptomyces sp. TP-A0356 TaxID=1359208 RepID=UPI000AEA0FF6|nr:class I SAM-dependent methyltransferase [Streptomyces sp. TP-A0356]
MPIWRSHGSSHQLRRPALTDEQLLALKVRERMSPARGDKAYALLADLRDALEDALDGAVGEWLDYGAGTAPYRSLLGGAKLRTADLEEARGRPVDYVVSPDGHLPLPDSSFDGVLSTQVLEHVQDPAVYLSECRRVLKDSGTLVLSTHGTWGDHGQVDLWRWTAAGLTAEVERAGFHVDRCLKLTGDARAMLTLLRRQMRFTEWPVFHPVGLLLKALKLLDAARPSLFDDYSDRYFPQSEQGSTDHRLYLVVLIVARPARATGAL